MDNLYDLVIIGGGPAGLSSAIYAGRARLKTLLIEKEKIGGQIVSTANIENYPGSLSGESGATLIGRMQEQAEESNVYIARDSVAKVEFQGELKVITGKAATYCAKAVIIATGAFPKPIGCPGEKELTGKGVSYCATCDGAFFEDMEIYVVGGGDAAVEEAIYLTRYGSRVTIIHRRDELRAARVLQEKAFANPKISFLWNSVVTEIKGEDIVESMVVKNVKTGELRQITADDESGTFGLFVFIGFLPQTEIFRGLIGMEGGYIITDDNMQTNIKGVFAAGDVRKKQLRQVVTAVSDGAVAATQAERFLSEI